MSTGEMTGPQISPKATKTQRDQPFENLRQNWCNRNRPIVADKCR